MERRESSIVSILKSLGKVKVQLGQFLVEKTFKNWEMKDAKACQSVNHKFTPWQPIV